MIAQSVCRIAEKLICREKDISPPADYHSLNENFETVKIEAEVDFEIKIRYLRELLHTEKLYAGGLAETVKSQQFEIERLKYENRLLKSKLVAAGTAKQ